MCVCVCALVVCPLFAQHAHKYHRCPEAPTSTVTATKPELLSYFTKMQTIRRLELACDALYKQKEIRGFLHLCNGQEAVAMGVVAALHPEDAIVTAYREHGYSLLRGGTVESIIAECIGRATGVSKGKGGSMHLFGVEHFFYGGNAIVGAQVPMGAGLAFAQKCVVRCALCIALCAWSIDDWCAADTKAPAAAQLPRTVTVPPTRVRSLRP